MPQFQFSVKDQEGNPTSGVIESPTQQAALQTLVSQNLIVTSVAPVQAGGLFARRRGGQARLRPEELISFTQSVTAMLEAGVNLKGALSNLALDAESPDMQEVLVGLDSRLSEGKPFSTGLQEFPRVFSRLYVSLVEAGEASGRLAEIMRRLVETITRDAEMAGKVRGALYYPIFVLVFAVLMVSAIFIFAVPRLTEVYASMNANLPTATKLTIAIGNHLSHWWPAWLAVLAGLSLGLSFLLRSPPGRMVWDGWILRLPLLGPVMRKMMIARFARIMGCLYGSGIRMDRALALAAGAVDNAVMEEAMRQAASNLIKGETLVQQLRQNAIFTNIAVSMVASGEESGALEKMLERLALFYESQSDMELRSLIALLEPAMVALVGVMVGGVVLTIALPFMQLSTILK